MGHVDVARYLLDQSGMIDDRSGDQSTALHWACIYGHAGFASFLLRRGADVTAVSDTSVTTLMEAAHYGHAAVVRVLLEHGGLDVDAVNGIGRTACHLACIRGHHIVLSILLEAGAHPTLRDAIGVTAMDVASNTHHQECIAVLQEWERAYTLVMVRRVRDATSATRQAAPPCL